MAPPRIPAQPLYDYSNSPEVVMERVQKLIAHWKQSISDLLGSIEPSAATFHNFMVPYSQLYHERQCQDWSLNLLFRVHPDEKVRRASSKANDLATSEMEWPNLTEYAKAIIARGENLDAQSQQFLESRIRAPTTSTRKEEIRLRLEEIQTQFEVNLVEEDRSKGVWLSEAELEGFPKDTIDSLEPGPKGFFVSRKSPTYPKVLKYCINPDSRKRIWVEKEKQDWNNGNGALMKETVVLRHENAMLSGKPNQASLELEKLKRNDPAALDKTFQYWDEDYYQGIWLKKTYLADETSISEYFPLQSTVRGMFNIFEKMFGIVVQQMDVKLWHKDAQVYSVWDDEQSGGAFSGYIYLDLIKREGKYEGGMNFGQQPSYVSRSGERRYAVTALLCPFTAPTATKPCLLSHADVVTLFHELGHSMHVVLSRSNYGYYTGTLNAYDFSEVPSLLLENWCWVPEVLKTLSKHYQTGERIPDDLCQSIVATRLSESLMLRHFQVLFASFDLQIYTPASEKEAKEMDLAEIWFQMRDKIYGLQAPKYCPRGFRYAKARHSVCDYPGSVSTYIVGFCIAEIIWKKMFEKDPLSREAGVRWRREVLEKGGTMKPMDMLENLLGRRIDVEDLCS